MKQKRHRVTVLKHRSRTEKTTPFANVLFLLLAVILTAAIGSFVTYAWISRNDTVTYRTVRMTYDVDKLRVGGITFDDGVITLVTDEASGTGNDNVLIPGSVLRMSIGIANEAGVESVIGLGFEAPVIYTASDGDYDGIDADGFDEIPTVVDGVLYYLGTQLTVSAVSYSIYDYAEDGVDDLGHKKLKATGTVVDHAPITDSDPVYMTTVDGDTVSGIETVCEFPEPIELGPSQVIAFDIVITFVNDSEHDQNVYQNFGSTNAKAKFSRTLAIHTD